MGAKSPEARAKAAATRRRYRAIERAVLIRLKSEDPVLFAEWWEDASRHLPPA